MQSNCILAIDQGTTGTKVNLFDNRSRIIGSAYAEFTQSYPQPGWVEHDPVEIWESTLVLIRQALVNGNRESHSVAALGITNQRETTVLWSRETGKPVAPAVVWQDRRTSGICDEWKKQGLEKEVRARTGLVIDAYFSASKIKWMLDHYDLRTRCQQGEIAFGTIDTWLIWKLTGGRVHATDLTNASRTMMFNIHTLDWDTDLMSAMSIPREILPRVLSSSAFFGECDPSLFDGASVPISGVAGDQQAALFGQGCYTSGTAKNTYGTGSFILMNTGSKPVTSTKGMLTTLACSLNGHEAQYALEGAVFVTGAAIQWLRDGLGIIKSANETEGIAESVPDSGGVYFVPALTGLGGPHWDPYARGLIIGLTRGTTAAHIVRAALESICFQSRDIFEAMQIDSGIELSELRVDGGAVKNSFLMQFQSDALGIPVCVPDITEATSLGAAHLAGLQVRFWKDQSELADQIRVNRRFEPRLDSPKREELYRTWRKAVERSKEWVSTM